MNCSHPLWQTALPPHSARMRTSSGYHMTHLGQAAHLGWRIWPLVVLGIANKQTSGTTYEVKIKTMYLKSCHQKFHREEIVFAQENTMILLYWVEEVTKSRSPRHRRRMAMQLCPWAEERKTQWRKRNQIEDFISVGRCLLFYQKRPVSWQVILPAWPSPYPLSSTVNSLRNALCGSGGWVEITEGASWCPGSHM